MSLKVPKAGGPDLFKAGYKVSQPTPPPRWERYTDNGHSVTFHLVLSPLEPVLMCSTCLGLRRPSFEISQL